MGSPLSFFSILALIGVNIMRNKSVRANCKQGGVSMVEYALVIGLIAGVCLLAIKYMGRSSEKSFWVSCLATAKNADGQGLDPKKVVWDSGKDCWAYDVGGPCLKSLISCDSTAPGN